MPRNYSYSKHWKKPNKVVLDRIRYDMKVYFSGMTHIEYANHMALVKKVKQVSKTRLKKIERQIREEIFS